jgi:hypothetical protein
VKFGHIDSHCQCNKICPILPKTTQNLPKSAHGQLVQETLKSHQKLRFWFFSKKKIPCVKEGAPKHEHIVWIFNLRIFHMPFSMSKKGLCMWISAYTFVQNDVFFKVPYISWIWDFVDMYLTHLGIRIWSPSIHTYSKKWFFWPPKLWCIPWTHGWKLSFSTLNLMILQTVWMDV